MGWRFRRNALPWPSRRRVMGVPCGEGVVTRYSTASVVCAFSTHTTTPTPGPTRRHTRHSRRC